ncbi:lysophospholipid acyltransferase family protein [Candidatus Margulisiibacteriota bacterium]
MKRIISDIYSFLLWAHMVLFFILWPLLALPFSLIFGRRRSFRFFFKVLLKLILLVFGLYPRVKGKENIPKGKNVILMSNHPGFLDPFQLNAALPGSYNFVVFAKILFNPLALLSIRSAGFVVRSFGHSLVASRTIINVTKEINKGDSFVLFPTEHVVINGHITKVKKGFYKIISDTNAVILPVHISGGIRIRYPKNPYRAKIVIGKPLNKNDILRGGDLFIRNAISHLSSH